MESILREKLLNQAQKLAIVSAIYRTESTRFVSAYFDWLEAAEKDLAHLRSPISILLQSEKTKLTSVLDGFLPDQIQSNRSHRRNQRSVAALSLSDLSQAIYQKIEKIDNNFEEIREKMAHGLAVLMGKEPDLMTNVTLTESSAMMVWRRLGGFPETLPMYHYFSAKLAAVDRKYLLLDIMHNLVENQPSLNKQTLAPVTVAPDVEPEETERGNLEIILQVMLRDFAQLKLEQVSFDALLDVAQSEAERKSLAKQAELDYDQVLALVKCADLQRITGVTFPLAFLLLRSGIDSVTELGNRNATNLAKKMGELITQEAYEIPAPNRDIVQAWVDEAKTLARRLSF